MIYPIVILIGLAATGFVSVRLIKHKSLYPFMAFKYDFRKRRDTFILVLQLLEKINAKVMIETGTSREGLAGAKSQGAATVVFGKWASQNKAMMYSVDISEESVAVAQAAVAAHHLSKYVQIHCSDSVSFLKQFDQRVDFLYLDSYDYSDDIEIQKASQLHHLEEFKAIEAKLHMNSIVLIDDCDLPGGGKGKLVIEYMLNGGWVIHTQAYQVLLLHKDFKV